MRRNKIINDIESIAQKAKKSKGNLHSIDKNNKSLQNITTFLNCESIHGILFSVVFVISFNEEFVGIDEVSDFMDCENLKLANYLKVIEELEKKKLLRRDNRGIGRNRNKSIQSIDYYIPKNVVDAILENNKGAFKRKLEFGTFELLDFIHELLEERDDDEISFDEMANEIENVLSHNKNLSFVKRIKHFDLTDKELSLLLYVCFETVNGDEEVDLTNACEKIFETTSERFQIRRELIQGKSDLIKKKLLKLQPGMFRNDKEILLTENALESLFEEQSQLIISDKQKNNLIKAEKIQKEKLFFNEETEEKLNFLNSVFGKNSFAELKKRLQEKGLSPGLSLLFYGSPGTGKTASAYQMARKSGRMIMPVDISKTKSMWYGESEKLIKGIFDDYGKAVKSTDHEPVLLFNECDGVLSKRRELRQSAVSQTENAIQNILLEELEKFEGILIATSNLTQNLDFAFERRFLYKIQFEKPDLHVRKKILQSFFPIISEEQAEKIASDFVLTGGNISNISKKMLMEEIIKGEATDFEKLYGLCREEIWQKQEARCVGYKV